MMLCKKIEQTFISIYLSIIKIIALIIHGKIKIIQKNDINHIIAYLFE
jgi:hypothetical protein